MTQDLQTKIQAEVARALDQTQIDAIAARVTADALREELARAQAAQTPNE